MYLKQVELQGFKSFATRSTFEFHNGITCIVGPNGSGKSNIADAVRWVLGEQSARQLRGHNMQDVIFAGTQSRRPVSYASVSLLLDNADHALDVDYAEVRVTRRIYRSGESEYLLNGTPCRLRDIQELFYDTGIGKEGYSLIGQGQIEKILSGKPQERRELFDEAAGIVKFKRRKAAALKKLETEQDNLVRVNDIITELERQVGPLKRQSEKARVYLQKKEALKEVDLQLFALQTRDGLKQKAQWEADLENLTLQLEEARASYETGKEESLKIEAQRQAQEQKIENLQSLLNETALQKTALEHQIDLLAAQTRAEELAGAHYKRRLKDLEESAAEKDAQLAEQAEKIRQLKQDALSAQAQRQETAEKLSAAAQAAAEAQRRTDEIKEEILALAERKTQAEASYQHYDTLLSETAQRRSQLEEDLLQAGRTRDLLRERVQRRTQELEEIRGRLSGARTAYQAAQQSLEDLTAERNSLRDSREETRKNLMQAQSQLETLRNMAERYEGYGQSIRAVMQKRHPGVIGVVANLLKTDQKYETAIETALGGSIQNIVTRDAAAAQEMIDYLKREKKGRATFLPLTEVKGRRGQQEEKALQEPGVIGMADTLVQCEETYRGIASSLLGGILVADNVQHALAIARKYHHTLRIVTLEGEYLRPGGSMTGGAFRNSSNLLGRRREQEVLEKRVRQYSAAWEKASRRLDQITDLRAQTREQIAAAQEEVSQLEITENTALMDLKRLSDEDASCAERENAAQDEMAQLDARLSESGMQHEDTASEISRIGEARGALENENERVAEQLRIATRERDTLTAAAEEQMLSLQAISQNLAFAEENSSRLAGEKQALLEETEEILKTRAEASEKLSGAAAQEEGIRDAIAQAQQKAVQAQTDLEQAQQERDAISASYRAFFEAREALTQDIARLEKEEYRLSGSLSQLKETMDARDTHIWEEYGLTRRQAMAREEEITQPEASLRRQAKEIEKEIRDLGNVNVNAIEEYKQVGERYELMTAQRDDVEKAAGNLEKMIANLDTGMRRQFREQFAKIQLEFQKVFRELFGGGNGTLELVAGEDDLETGIEIIAQPPGKKLQNMMQLSGGEKALTAICLLFAIQNLKPSPFCILDEIEAALDEPNVDRFAQYLKKLSGRTQFIVITHRRGSMAAADRLYGVTMQEKGVSTQVSVELAEAEMAGKEA